MKHYLQNFKKEEENQVKSGENVNIDSQQW